MKALSQEERARLIAAMAQAGELRIVAKLLDRNPVEVLGDLTGVRVLSLVLQVGAGRLGMGERVVELSGPEADLIAVLAARPDLALSRTELADLLNVLPARVGPIATAVSKAVRHLIPAAGNVVQRSRDRQHFAWDHDWPVLILA